jgi:hypothetical protein
MLVVVMRLFLFKLFFSRKSYSAKALASSGAIGMYAPIHVTCGLCTYMHPYLYMHDERSEYRDKTEKHHSRRYRNSTLFSVKHQE